MKPLYEDQITAVEWQKISTHIWSDDLTRSEKSGVWDYFQQTSKE